MNPYELIKEIIRNDCDIDLRNFDSLVYIIKRTECNTLNEWNKIDNYLKKYTEFTQRTLSNGQHWTMSDSIKSYVRYLKAFEHTDAPLFPKEDFFYLGERMEISVINAKSQIAKECATEAFKYVSKYHEKIEG